MALDGIMFEGVTVRVRRPNDYNPAAADALGPSVPNRNLNLGAIGLQPGAGMVSTSECCFARIALAAAGAAYQEYQQQMRWGCQCPLRPELGRYRLATRRWHGEPQLMIWI